MGRSTTVASMWTRASHDGLQVLRAVLCDSGEDPFRRWVVDGARELIATLRETLVQPSDDDPVKVAVVLAVPQGDDPWTTAAAAAACEAARGIVGALTLERGPAVRLNLVLTTQAGTSELAETLDLLVAPEGSFVAGTTFDLREAR